MGTNLVYFSVKKTCKYDLDFVISNTRMVFVMGWKRPKYISWIRLLCDGSCCFHI